MSEAIEPGPSQVHSSHLYDETGLPIRSKEREQKTEDLVRFIQERPVMTASGALVLGYVDRKVDWYARGVGGAAAREIKGIPAGRP